MTKEQKQEKRLMMEFIVDEAILNPLEKIEHQKPAISFGVKSYESKDGEIIFQKTSDGSTYCTGFTFSVFFVTALNRGLLDDWTNDDIEKLHKVWNQGEPTAKPKLCVDAISKPINNHKPLGKEISLNNALEGDYCQIWRTTGTGHSVIFLERVMKNNKVVGIKYISSNASVNPKTGRTGVGEKIEYFSDSGGKVIRENTYYARMNK
jgi:hypothetical protein